MLSWFWPGLDRETQLEWERVWRTNGVTHVVLCPVASYPGYWAPTFDWRADPGRYAEANRRLLDDHFVPVNFYATGDGGSDADIDLFFAGYDKALRERGLLPYVWRVPGFEVVGPGAGWRSASLSRALVTLCADHSGPIGVHLQPERATGASYGGSGYEPAPSGYVWHDYHDPARPGFGAYLEDDDPWQGDEAGFWTRHGGECADALLYQTPHGSKLLDPNGAGPDVGAWEDRFVEILDRLGVGGRGWRRVGVSFFETVGYDLYHGRATDEDGERIANRAYELCLERGVTCTFGNGVPSALKIRSQFVDDFRMPFSVRALTSRTLTDTTLWTRPSSKIAPDGILGRPSVPILAPVVVTFPTPFVVSVKHVVRLRAQKQMIRPYAPWRVATMKNEQTVRNSPKMKCPRKTVRVHKVSSGDAQNTITEMSRARRPQPTPVLGFSYLAPKSNDSRFMFTHDSIISSDGYDFDHGWSDEGDAVRLANRAKQLCDERGVACTFGNGVPK